MQSSDLICGGWARSPTWRMFDAAVSGSRAIADRTAIQLGDRRWVAASP